MKKFTVLVFLIFAILSNCKSSKENISYLFPSKMKVITNTEIDSLCDKVFTLQSSFSSKKKLQNIPLDSVVFKKEGSIYSFNKKVGTWQTDRTIYLSNYKRKFYFNYITKNSLRIYSRYQIEKNTTLKQIRIRLVSEKNRESELESEFDF
ncbi:MAG: hypothetical protein CMP76_01325 [Flavobacterium sp.]|nr:hypothetical protein [Flavobacterium sp.]|tara:strand:- start:184 stop:633 length:450 start_codon:yes stop_codon:yes gene_type:complete